MALSPLNPTVSTSSATEFTSTINNAVWQAESGSFTAGSTSYKKIFTAPGTPQIAAITAKEMIWSTSYSHRNAGTDAITLVGGEMLTRFYTRGILKNPGDKITIVTEPNPSNDVYYFIGNDTDVNFFHRGDQIYYTAVGGVVFTMGSSDSGSTGSGGVTFDFVLNKDSKIELYRNGVLKGTSTTVFTNLSTDPLKFSWRSNTVTDGVTFAAPVATPSYWGTLSDDFRIKGDGLIEVFQQTGNSSANASGAVGAIGGYFDYKHNGIPHLLYILDSAGGFGYAYLQATSLSVYDGSSTLISSGHSFSSGDTLRVKLIDDGSGNKLVRLIKNPAAANTTLYTIPLSTKAWTGNLQSSIFVSYGVAINTTFNPMIYSNDWTQKYQFETTSINIVASIAISSITRPTTSINLGATFAPTVTTSNGSGTKSYVWKVGGSGGTIITEATTANPTIPVSYLTAGLKTLYIAVTDDTGTTSTTTTVFVADITGAASTENATEDYDHNLSNVTSGSITVLSGGGTIAVVDSNTVRFTKPTSSSGTSVIKIADSTDSDKYGTKSINWTADATAPNMPSLGAVTNSGAGVSIAFTPATDNVGGSGIAKLKFYRSTDDFATQTLIDNVANTSPFLDTNASRGVAVKYKALAVDNLGNESSLSSAVSGQRWNLPPQITTVNPLPNARLTQAYDEIVEATGGDGMLTITVKPTTSLPSWLTLATVGGAKHLQGTHNALATNEAVHLRVTDANGQYTDFDTTITTVDTINPTNVSNVVATKISDSQVDITSDGATDNSGVLTYINQRSSDNFTSDIITLPYTTKDFSDTYELPPGVEKTYKWGQKAKDGSNNVSALRVLSNAVTLSPPPAPVFLTQSPLPYAQTGKPYSFQFAIAQGSGSGTYNITFGNLSPEAMDENGLITIEETGDSNYTFTVLYEDDNGMTISELFTIPVSEYAVWTFLYRKPVEIDYVEKVRVFEPIQGAEEAVEDAPTEREFALNTLYVGLENQQALVAFLREHKLRRRFLFKDEFSGDMLIVRIVKPLSESQLYAHGTIDVTIKEVVEE